MKKIKVGIIGCGTIGEAIARACAGRLSSRVRLVGLADVSPLHAARLAALLKRKSLIKSMDRVLSDADLIVEAASAAAAPGILLGCIRKRRNCLIMSVGGLIGHESSLRLAEKRGIRVFIPSGALCGIDGLKAACAGKIESVTLTTRKPALGLAGAPYVRERGIDLGRLTTERVIFEGNAVSAVKGFPQNVNVSAVLSLAGIGARRTRVRIVADPAGKHNIHEVEIRGEFGVITTRTRNLPSVGNPKTSAMAFFSAIAALDGATRTVRVGT